MKHLLAGISGIVAGVVATSSLAASKCDPASLKAPREALRAAYERALASFDAPRRAALEKSQNAWLQNYRETTALMLSDPACTPGKLLGTETLEQRRAWIEGGAETGLREPIVQPFSVWRDAKPGEWRLMLDLARFEKPSLPGDHLFNSTIARIGKDAENHARTSGGGVGNDVANRPYEYSARVRLVYASPRLLSARVDEEEDAGGAHPVYPTFGVTIDRQAGIALNFEDLFDFGAVPPLEKDCARQVEKETGRKLGKDEKENLRKGVGDLAHWHFTADGATIVFRDYEVGSFADGHPSCRIPLAMLKKLAQPEAPLPDDTVR